MGLKPWELRRITYRDYCEMTIGEMNKRFETLDFVRMIETAILNYGGMGGSKKAITPQEYRPIPTLDNADIVIPIRDRDKASKLLKEFEKWQDYR